MPDSELSIPGQTAIVTGAGSGIGRHIADHLSQAGVNVLINDIRKEPAVETVKSLGDNEGNVDTVVGDASDPDVARSLVETAIEKFDCLDIIVNNVGIAGPTKPCEEISNDKLMNTLEINIGSAFHLAKAAIPEFKQQKSGYIINISSISGKRPLRNRTPYTISKMGIIGFTRTLALELGEYGVNVNAICPGSVEGPRLDSVIKKQAESQGRPVEEVRTEFQKVSAKNNFVDPNDIADTVLYLCSERAKNVTGQDLNVSAGVVMY